MKTTLRPVPVLIQYFRELDDGTIEILSKYLVSYPPEYDSSDADAEWIEFKYGGHIESEALFDAIVEVAPYAEGNHPIILTGEPGTGKGVLAKSISVTRDSAKPFVDVNCGTIPSSLAESELFGHVKGAFTGADMDRVGYVEEADGGTLFLDEIQELPSDVQGKLLKYVESSQYRRLGEVKVRRSKVKIIAASHFDLGELSQRGGFLPSLYERLNVGRGQLPSLRHQRAAIWPMFQRFMADEEAKAPKKTVIRYEEPSVEHTLKEYHWPGNVRELMHCAQRTFILSKYSKGLVTADLVKDAMNLDTSSTRPAEEVKSHDRLYYENLLRLHGGNVSAMARDLKVDRNTLNSKLKKLGLVPAEFRKPSK